jgi:methylmalonyl-CoA/ethylmalonyl-CoA epimerase
MDKIEHIGIAVRNLDESEKLYTALLGVPPYKRESVESEHVMTSFYKLGPNKIELLMPTSDDSAIHKYLEKRGEGIHHVAYAVKDIEVSMKEKVKEGFRLLNEKAKVGADNKLVCFIHPKSAGGVLVELCQEIAMSNGQS